MRNIFVKIIDLSFFTDPLFGILRNDYENFEDPTIFKSLWKDIYAKLR